MKTLRSPNRLHLSLANIDAASVTVDWSAHEDSDPHESYGVPLCFERDYEIVLPSPMFGDVDGHASDLFNAAQQKTADRYPERPLPDDLREEFEQSDGYDEWRQGFDPMMNFVWPVRLGYEVSAKTAADLIAVFAPTATLIAFTSDDKVGEEYGIALSGGGMNLSDQLAIAYLCCGCVPPATLLMGLHGVIDSYHVKRVGAELRKAYKLAATYYKTRAKRLAETSALIMKQGKAA